MREDRKEYKKREVKGRGEKRSGELALNLIIQSYSIHNDRPLLV